jgi:hypothetical protein
LFEGKYNALGYIENIDHVLDAVLEICGPCPHTAMMDSEGSEPGYAGYPVFLNSHRFSLLSPLLSRRSFGSGWSWNSILAMPLPSQVTLDLNSFSLYSLTCKVDIILTSQGC